MKKQSKKTTWHRVEAPKPWRPKVGQEIVGEYLSTETKTGPFGEYKAHYIKTADGTFYVSGAMVNDLFSIVDAGTQVKLVFDGKKTSNESGNQYKVFELFAEQVIEFKIAKLA